MPATTGGAALTETLRALDQESVPVADLTLRRPSLDDVFLTLTGHAAETAPAKTETKSKRRIPQ